MQWNKGVQGNLYYSTTAWRSNPWINPVSPVFNNAGEGFLLYPPFKTETPTEPCFEGPVTSIRWELVREGIEDYEYLWLLEHYINIMKLYASSSGFIENSFIEDAEDALTHAVDTMVDWTLTSWEKSATKLYDEREKVAMQIEKLHQYIPDDITPPHTYLESGPSGFTDQHNLTFIWNGTDNCVLPSDLVYSHKLYGYDSCWSPWASNTSATYTNLPSSEFIFKVKARDLERNIEPIPAETSFIINDPPQANFTYIPPNSETTNTIDFTFIDTSIEDHGVEDWQWDFGDGNTSKGGACLSFNGNNRDYVKSSNSIAVPSEGTISGWIKGNKDDQISENIYPFGFHQVCVFGPNSRGGGRSGLIVRDLSKGENYYWNWGNQNIYDGNWHYYVVTWDEEFVRLYIDGEQIGNPKPVGNETITNKIPVGDLRTINIGTAWTNGGYGPHTGEIDDVCIYNRALSSSEIQNNYNRNIVTNGLISWWKLDEGK
jgi:hypothetical protein